MIPRSLGDAVTASVDRRASPRKRHALALFENLPGQYDRMSAMLSFGQDPRWRRTMVEAVDPRPGQRVLDVATGTGLVASELVRRGACNVIALDQSDAMLAGARARLASRPDLAERITFVRSEAEQLPFSENEFDALTFTYLLRYVDDRAATMRELVRVVKPCGKVGMVEFGVPDRPLPRAAWRVYTRLGLPVIGRVVSPAWAEVGRFLGPNIEHFYDDQPDLCALWRAAGLRAIAQRKMSFGAGLVMWGLKGPTDGSGERD